MCEQYYYYAENIISVRRKFEDQEVLVVNISVCMCLRAYDIELRGWHDFGGKSLVDTES